MMMEKKLKIALIGYGKMGKAVGQLARDRGHEVVVIIDSQSEWETKDRQLQACDVAFEFTTPATASGNIRKCFDAGVPVVCGTTGWLHELPAITRLCNDKQQSLFYATNFSVGVNFFFELNKRLAGFLANLEGYRPRIMETHHTEKLDAPSGTAITLANDIISHREKLTQWVNADQDEAEHLLPIKSYRIENITGTHVVRYDSVVDSIEIKHTSHNRSGFAEGALLAAQWLQNKTGVFCMHDLLNI
ncbi:MAG: 4-hydroxy-tetrahydrodipicolinate reductase [Bacteroidales bacterium]|nr:4-hydroxy-tetrahydrodipicolinate reductase [Bacteroidales bacterium]